MVLEKINQNIERLISHSDRLAKENEELRKERERLVTKDAERAAEIALLKKKIETIEFSNGLVASEGDSSRARRRLKKILREIDECIALITK